mmetsp:Transcript_14772/g.45795  ORF Transcript_14772/g.45795 Transcript_14772/m.45795 type:complete len:88 (+) Transcript_14772:372-635(+)
MSASVRVVPGSLGPGWTGHDACSHRFQGQTGKSRKEFFWRLEKLICNFRLRATAAAERARYRHSDFLATSAAISRRAVREQSGLKPL